jgi:hypothetical protein
VLMAAVGARGDHQERRLGDRRKLEQKAVGASGSSLVLTERGKSDRAAESEEGHRGEVTLEALDLGPGWKLS